MEMKTNRLYIRTYILDTAQMIGYVCFYKEQNKYDLGYCFHSAYHLDGYAYESTKAIIEYLFKEYGASNFTAGTAIDNIPSCNLLKTLSLIEKNLFLIFISLF